MPKLPVVSGRATIRALERRGFVVERQRSSHVTLSHPVTKRHVTVPVHASRDLKPGILRRIIRDAGLTVDGFRELLK